MNKLQDVYISNASLKTLFIPSNIVSLNAEYNQISPITIDNEPNNFLDILLLNNNSITTLNFTGMSRLNKLRILQLQSNPITRKSIDIVDIPKNLPSLEGLSISIDNKNMIDELLQEAEKNHIRFGVSFDDLTNYKWLIFQNFESDDKSVRYTSFVGGDEHRRDTSLENHPYYIFRTFY